MTTALRAFHNDPAIKIKYLARVREHARLDQLIKGTYWSHGKGCAVGCTVHSGDHEAYERALGIPQILARLEDSIFEGLPNADAMRWPERFLESIPVGADLSKVWPQFAVWLLDDPGHGMIRFAHTKQEKSVILSVANAYRNSQLNPDWVALRNAAADAAAAAYAAAADAYHADDSYADSRQHQAAKLLDLLSKSP